MMAAQLAFSDWVTDLERVNARNASKETGKMSKRAFFEGLFELADLWT